MAKPPQMWSTHPENSDREENAKKLYVKADIDERDAWIVFSDPQSIRKNITKDLYTTKNLLELSHSDPKQAVINSFSKEEFSPEYRGTYLNRSPVRNFATSHEIFKLGNIQNNARASLAGIYPESIADDLKTARSLDNERYTLEALERGELKPSGGVIRHRGEEINKRQIPDAIKTIVTERLEIASILKAHDASCRRAHLQAAEELQGGWKEYLVFLIKLLHCTEHMQAKIEDESALLINTWQVITADGQVGYFEKRRLMKVCKNLHEIMNEISERTLEIDLSPDIKEQLGISDWQEQCPQFQLVKIDNKNWPDWCKTALDSMNAMSHALNVISQIALTEMIQTESMLRKHLADGTTPEQAPVAGKCPKNYPVLLPGEENVLQRKLDLWNRFQLAHGFFPTLARLIVSLGIVGSTIVYGGLLLI